MIRSRYQPGDIVQVILDEPRGRGKVRWMLVLTDLDVSGPEPYYLCVAITTTFPEPPPAINVPLPWHPEGKASTGLRRRSAAVLDWVRKMRPDKILHLQGYVQPSLVRKIDAELIRIARSQGRQE